jgi:phage terminase large subunit
VRKVRADIAKSALVSFERHILGEDSPICKNVKREYRQVYRYPNGSEIVIGGMDRPTSVMSAEYDFIYVQEAIELNETDWESLTTRLRNNRMPFQQIIGDTNPSYPEHWLLGRAKSGAIRYLESYHEDNPAYFDARGELTELGRIYIATLDALTGVRKERLRFGRWVTAEGAIYENYSPGVHLIDDFEIPAEWTRFRAVDFGYNHAFVCQWWAVDNDGRMYLYREIYHTGRLVEDHAQEIKRLSAGERVAWTVADHDAEDRATLARHGIKTIAADKRVLAGIQAVQERIKVQGDGKPKIFILRGALVREDEALVEKKLPARTADEFAGYVWDNRAKKEAPIKENDHGLDALRYAVMSAGVSRVARVSKENPFF